MSIFDHFTDRARRVVVLAQDEARMLNHNYMGTEHLLLGLIHEGGDVATSSLEPLGVTLEAVREQVEEIIGLGTESVTGHIPFSPRSKKVIELSMREALDCSSPFIRTEHILLSILREGQGVAAQILIKLGVSLDHLRDSVAERQFEPNSMIAESGYTIVGARLRIRTPDGSIIRRKITFPEQA